MSYQNIIDIQESDETYYTLIDYFAPSLDSINDNFSRSLMEHLIVETNFSFSLDINQRIQLLDVYNTANVACVTCGLPYSFDYPGEIGQWIRKCETPINPAMKKGITPIELCSFCIFRIIGIIPILPHIIKISQLLYEGDKLLEGDEYFINWEFEFGEYGFEKIATLSNL